jgi:hypothetical protein
MYGSPEDAFRRFGENLMPVLQEIAESQPGIYPAHTLVSA